MADKNDKKASTKKAANGARPNTSSGSFFGAKFWVLTLTLVLGPALLLARFSLIQLNFDKPLKANYIELPPFKPMEGNMAPNTKLESAKLIAHGKIRGPETIVFTPDGTLLTGLMNGQVVRVSKDGKKIEKLVQMGDEQNETLCNDYGPDLKSHSSCGRPLGMRLRDNWLYVADSFLGIFKVDIKTGQKKLLLSSNDKRLGPSMKLTNDLDLDGDVIYFIDSSYEHDVNEAVEEHLEALARGRLFSYNEKTDKVEFLLENLYFPNGLQLMPDKNSILINEHLMARIIKFHLKGEKKGIKEVFADIPGFGDTIRLTDRNTLLVPFAAVRPARYASLLDLTGKLPIIRTLAGFVINMRQMFMLLPKYGLMAEYDLNGQPLRSWHDPSGKMVQCTTAAAIHDGKLYMGSFYHDFIAVADY